MQFYCGGLITQDVMLCETAHHAPTSLHTVYSAAGAMCGGCGCLLATGAGAATAAPVTGPAPAPALALLAPHPPLCWLLLCPRPQDTTLPCVHT